MTTFTTPWRPIFDERPRLAPVSGDSRPAAAQVRDFLARARAMRADPAEHAEIVEALQLCERAHGAAAIARAVTFVEGLLACSVASLGVPLRQIAAICGHGRSATFVGALVEDELGVEPEKRRFALVDAPGLTAGPALAFGDCTVASRWMQRLGVLSPAHADRLAAYARLAQAVRVVAGRKGVDHVTSLAHAAAADPAGAEIAFVRALESFAVAGSIDLGVAWQWHARGVLKAAEPRPRSWDVGAEGRAGEGEGAA